MPGQLAFAYSSTSNMDLQAVASSMLTRLVLNVTPGAASSSANVPENTKLNPFCTSSYQCLPCNQSDLSVTSGWKSHGSNSCKAPLGT
jgi:hypothetical protein